MNQEVVKQPPKAGTLRYLRRLSKSGGARYLSVGKIFPPDWQDVVIYVTFPANGCVVLKAFQIK